jgi:hypothetical protein
MSPQDLLNIAGAILLAGFGWWLNILWSMVKSLQEQVSMLHVKLVEQYAPRTELHVTFVRIFEKLDAIQKVIKE